MKKKYRGILLMFCLFVVFLILARIRFQQNELGKPATERPVTEKSEAAQTELTKSSALSEIKSEAVKEQQKNPSHLSEQIEENLMVDADVTEGTGIYNEYKIDVVQLSLEDAKAALLNLTGETANEPECVDENFWMYTPDGGYIAEVDGDIYLKKDDKAADSMLSILNVWGAETKEKNPDKELSYMSKQEAVDCVKAFIQTFTQEECEAISIYAVDEQEIDKFGKQEGETPEKEQYTGGVYWIQMGCRKDGIPVYSAIGESYANNTMDWEIAKECMIEAVVTKDGLWYFDMAYPYTVQTGEKQLDILSAKEAVDKALIPLQNLITDGKTVIDNIYLEYVPIASEELWKPQLLRPYWTIEYTNTATVDGNTYTTKDNIRINAETGENLAYGK